MANETYSNVRVYELPEESNNILNALANIRGLYKWQIIREALIEYADRHRKDLEVFARRTTNAKDT